MFSTHTTLGEEPGKLQMHPLTLHVGTDECLVIFSSHDKMMRYLAMAELKGDAAPIETPESLVGVLKESPLKQIALDPDLETGETKLFDSQTLIHNLERDHGP